MIKLRDGSSVSDPRLDRLINFDERSRKFAIRKIIKARKPRSRFWTCATWLDQGREGACVGFGISHELCAQPAVAKGVDNQYAREQIYWPAQRQDDWPGGSYPGAKPIYEGTSVLAGVKVAQSLGWFDSYHWAFGLDDLIMGVSYNGPAVLGLPWMEGMFEPDLNGVIHATGAISGGHCILCRGLLINAGVFLLHNSWGQSWGHNGECYITFKDMDKLLHQDGEAVFFINRHSVPHKKKEETPLGK